MRGPSTPGSVVLAGERRVGDDRLEVVDDGLLGGAGVIEGGEGCSSVIESGDGDGWGESSVVVRVGVVEGDGDNGMGRR